MAICSVCNTPFDGEAEVKCSGVCKGVFHSSCIKNDGDGVTTRSAKNWKCKDCRQSSVSSKASVESTSITKDFLIRVLEDFKQEVFTEFKSFKSEVNDLSTSVQFLSDKVDSSNTLMSEIKQEMRVLRKENEELRANNVALKSMVGDLQDRLRHVEQYSRKNNVEISGIPTTPQENVREIVRDLGAALGVEVQLGQISAAHRIPSYNKQRTPSLVVQFHDHDIKETLLTRFREARSESNHLTANKINRVFPPDRVYVNDHLSPENKQFLAKLKKRCQETGYAFVWCRDGKFFVRKEAGAKVAKVSTQADIDKLK